MTPQELKLKRALISLIMSEPFYATLLLGLPRYESQAIPTMATDGTCILWNPEFVNERNEDELKAILCHEVMHVAYLHHLRMGSRNTEKWNMATDFAINKLIKDSGFALPKECLFNSAYKDKHSEEIYNLLPDENKKGGGHGGNGGWNVGEVQPFPGKSESERREEADKQKIRVIQAANVAKSVGKLPAGIERLVNEILDPQVDWLTVLRRFVNEKARNDYNWRLPNKRYVQNGIYLPFMESQTMGAGVVSIDTSGSMSQEEIRDAITEVWGILGDFDGVQLEIIWFDAKVHGTQTVRTGDSPKIMKPRGGGGTDFSMQFNYIDKKMLCPNFLICMTDGYDDTFPKVIPNYPVLWMLTGKNDQFKPPFGEIVRLRKEALNV